MCVCVCARARARVFVLHALNFENNVHLKMCERLGPVRVRRSKYPLLLLPLIMCPNDRWNQ